MIKNLNINLIELTIPKFETIYNDIMEHRHTHYDFSGGRGSTKSSFISLVVILLLIQSPKRNAVVFRKIKTTLRKTVFEQYKWAIQELGLGELFRTTVSPMEITFLPTGQKIMFIGGSDVDNIKSIKLAKGYVAITHFEEKDQFAGRAEIRKILQSTQRGGDMFWNFESYNPPITKSNWANKDTMIKRPNRLCVHNDYREVPIEWLGQAFIEEANILKEQNPRAYDHEYLGRATGTGGNIFENAKNMEMDDDFIATFDNIFEGIDWGYYPDPFQWGRMYFDSTRRNLYIYDELRLYKSSNQNSYNELVEKKNIHEYNHLITADSAEPKSVGDLSSYGAFIRGAKKGPDSIDYGIKWLQSLNNIFIDKRRCPYLYNEFVDYEYERGKDGEIISGYPDEDNHGIDMTRYAMERVFRKRGQ